MKYIIIAIILLASLVGWYLVHQHVENILKRQCETAQGEMIYPESGRKYCLVILENENERL